MTRVLWFILLFSLASCAPDSTGTSQWDGTYIGYYHHNQEDTIPLTLVLEGRYFAAAPRGNTPLQESAGVFSEDKAALIFHNTTEAATLALDGAYKYEFGADGSVRIWQMQGDQVNEMILRHR